MKSKSRLARLAPCALALHLLLSLVSAQAQQARPPLWEKLTPSTEEFTAQMPGKPEISSEKAPYGQITVTTTFYTVATQDGPLFMISSVSGMEPFLAIGSGPEGMTAAAEGFRTNFLKEFQQKGVKAEMKLERDLKLNGYLGKEFSIAIGEITGLARLYTTKRKLYAVLVLNALEDDKRVRQFLDSFILKAASNDVEIIGPTAIPKVLSAPRVTSPPAKHGAQSNPPPAAAKNQEKPRPPISGGVLNGKAISLPKPVYPKAAKQEMASGTVTVQITIDENGDVISANAISGHPLLQEACVAAAWRAKFTPTLLEGQPVKVTGIVTYNFIAQ